MMATNDYVVDLVEKLSDDSIEYLVIAIQKGGADHKANAYYSISSAEGADMILTTVDEVFKSLDDDDEAPPLSEGAD